ncbi:cytochrome c-type biogenesis protein [Sneathiella sp.]|uniref:cytochrome c-type biogenesis protein n=1 Tax=Sneathiella sp. TaxID=1964365 RepID=UPI002FE256E1
MALCRTMLLVLFMLPLPALPAAAVFLDQQLEDPALEARARAVSAEIRCLVCQNQSILDSNADLAKDLRQIVRERIALGDSDSDVRAYLVSRYGDWVLLDPPFKLTTLLLWLGPAIIFIGGLIVTFLFLRGRSRPATEAAPAAFTREEEAELERLLGDDRREDPS